MHLPYQPQAKWEIFEPREPIVHGANVVDDLLDVLGDRVFLRVHLKGKDIFQSALRALNLGTKNGLVADVHGHEQVGIWQDCGHPIESAEGPVGL